MFTYEVTATGPKGFQVCVTVSESLGTYLLDDFASSAAAEAFVAWMRKIDAGQTTVGSVSLFTGVSDNAVQVDDLIQRVRISCALAAKACSDASEARIKAFHLRSLVAMNQEVWYRLRETCASSDGAKN